MSKKKVLTKWANARLERQNVDWMDLPYFKQTFEDTDWDVGLRFRIVPAWRFNGRIFETLQWMYMDAWDTKIEASRKANKVVIDFYRAADKCSQEWKKPFKVYITRSDKKSFNN